MALGLYADRMMRILTLLVLLLALAAPARAQNSVCPDVAAGDSSNSCANTRFVQGALGPLTKGAKDTVLTAGGTGNIAAPPLYRVPPAPFYSADVSSFAVATWTKYAGIDVNAYVDVAWSPELGIFVSGSTAGTIKTSTDGVTWTARTAGAAAAWHGVIWVSELKLFVMVGATNGTSTIQTSPDGVTWTVQAAPNSNNWDHIAWSPQLGLLVAVSFSGVTDSIMTSPDAVTWTARTTPTANAWNGVEWSPELGIFVAVGTTGTGNRVMTSVDGINWTMRSVPVDRNWDDIVWSPQLGIFVAVSYSGTPDSVMTSADGINWTLRTTPTTNQWTRVEWSPQLGQFAATGNVRATNNIMTSTDGVTWITHTTSREAWGGIAWSPELSIFAAVSWAGSSMVSTQPVQRNKIPQLQSTPFTAYTPIATATSGTFTTLGPVVGRYKVVGKLVYVQIQIPITTNGTASGHVRVTLPFPCIGSFPYVMAGYEDTSGGKMLSGITLVGTNGMQISNYDFTYPGGDAARLVMTGFYEMP